MKDLYADAKFMVEHAKGHISEANQLAKSFFEGEPYEFVTQADRAHPGYKIQLLRLSEPLPKRISALASDAAKNLRSVLDHVGHIAACASGNDGRSAYFPFGDNFTEANSRRTGASKDIPNEIFDLMMAFRPYKGGNHALWSLNKLANTNKHETLVRAALFAEELVVEGDGFHLNVGPRKGVDDKIPLAWVPPGQPMPNHKFKISASVRFNDFKGVAVEEHAMAFLNRVSGITERIVMDVEAESKRLGHIR